MASPLILPWMTSSYTTRWAHTWRMKAIRGPPERCIERLGDSDAAHSASGRSAGHPRTHGFSPGDGEAIERTGGNPAARPKYAVAGRAGTDCRLRFLAERLSFLSVHSWRCGRLSFRRQ